MKSNKKITSSILSIVFSSIWIVVSSIVAFVLWLVLGIGKSFDENFSAPLQTIAVVLLILTGIICIVKIVISSLIIKGKNLYKVNITILCVSFIFNITLAILLGGLWTILIYIAFAITDIICLILIIISLKNHNNLTKQKGI